jgi:hypothetical protein
MLADLPLALAMDLQTVLSRARWSGPSAFLGGVIRTVAARRQSVE